MISIIDIEKEHDVEMALIILCIRNHFKQAESNEISAYIQTKQIDWVKFKTYSEYHRVQPIVYQSVLKCGEKFEEINLFKNILQQITIRNWQLAQETERVIQLFHKEHIQAVPYKGSAFSQQFYGNLVSRFSSDIDLIIDWENLRPCIQILKNEGYVPENEMELLHGWDSGLKHAENEYNLDYIQNGQRLYHVELHWSIGNSEIEYSNEATQLLKANAEKQTLIKDKIISLTDDSHFLAILFHHSGKDVFNFFRNLIDIAQASQKINDYQWINIHAGIEKVGLIHSYEIARILIEKLIGIQIPIYYQVHIPFKTKQLFTNALLSSDMWVTNKSKLAYFYYFMVKRILLLDSKTKAINLVYRHIHHFAKPSIKDYFFLPLYKHFHFIYIIVKPFRILKGQIFKNK